MFKKSFLRFSKVFQNSPMKLPFQKNRKSSRKHDYPAISFFLSAPGLQFLRILKEEPLLEFVEIPIFSLILVLVVCIMEINTINAIIEAYDRSVEEYLSTAIISENDQQVVLCSINEIQKLMQLVMDFKTMIYQKLHSVCLQETSGGLFAMNTKDYMQNRRWIKYPYFRTRLWVQKANYRR